MKQALWFSIALLLGVLVGVLAAMQILQRRDVAFRTVEAQEFVLVDTEHRPVAKLASTEDRTTLSFLDSHDALSLEIGTNRKTQGRFVNFIGADGHRILASLRSWGPNGESTIQLGDEAWEGRAILGFLTQEMPGSPVESWGFILPEVGSTTAPPAVGVSVQELNGKMRGLIRLKKSDGSALVVE